MISKAQAEEAESDKYEFDKVRANEAEHDFLQD
jgi:hypothetical protein